MQQQKIGVKEEERLIIGIELGRIIILFILFATSPTRPSSCTATAGIIVMLAEILSPVDTIQLRVV